MKTRFVLMATTRGDELIPSSTSVVADSDNREALETLREARAKERADYLIKNTIPWWAETGIISHEEIREVASV